MERRRTINIYFATFVGESRVFDYGTPVVLYEKVTCFDTEDRGPGSPLSRAARVELFIGAFGEEPWWLLYYTGSLADIEYVGTKEG